MPGIDDIGRITEALDAIRSNIGTKPRTKYYVDSTRGNDNYSGLSRDDPVHSINTAIGLAGHGDVIHIARDTYDEAISIPAGKIGLQIICEPGVYLVNTTPGTVVAIASALVYWDGGIIETNGQIGMSVNDDWFIGKNIRVYNSSVGFDLNSPHPLLIDCFTNETSVAGFDISEDSGIYLRCGCHGAAASRGFYLSHTNAHNNILKNCTTLGCTAAGYECVAGADENIFDHCSQSVLCAGPTDAGANNTWIPIDGLLTPNETAGPFSYLNAGLEQTVYEDATTVMRKISLDLDLNAMTQNGTVRLYRKTDGANYRIWIEEAYNVGGAEKVFSRDNIVTNQHFKVTYQEAADEGADRSIPYNVITEPMEI
jgi:hypothetical protein